MNRDKKGPGVASSFNPPPESVVRALRAAVDEASKNQTVRPRLLVTGADEATARWAAAQIAEWSGIAWRPLAAEKSQHPPLNDVEKDLLRELAEASRDNVLVLVEHAEVLFGHTSQLQPWPPEVLPVLQHALEQHEGPLLLWAAEHPTPDQIAAGRFAAAVALDS
jgi:hypothetical protein